MESCAMITEFHLLIIAAIAAVITYALLADSIPLSLLMEPRP